ncbi:MAG: hypothetical protein HQ593_02785 [Candidatus Omnitrophica bacterium]|nr:hypothetical protein [Candidatus Omnitrophota bacterium]
MLKINLLPPDLKKKQIPSLKWQNLGKMMNFSLLPVIAGAVAFLMILQISVMMVLAYKRKVLASYKSKWEIVAPDMKQITRLKDEVDGMEGAMEAIGDLAKGRLLWAKLLKGLSDSLTPGVWLTKFKVSEILGEPTERATVRNRDETTEEAPTPKKRMLILNGSVAARKGEETAYVGRFVDSLKRNEYFFDPFSEIELDSIERRKMGEVEVMDFELICRFKE